MVQNWTSFFRPKTSPRKTAKRACLEMDSLEERLVLTAVANDMTELAEMFPRHSGPTRLYLNFDGNSNEGVASFQSGNRNQDIQEILYMTAQIFAPFDVEVRRMSGDGNLSTTNGNTTIFIGDHPDYTINGSNGSGGFASSAHSDFPHGFLGGFHQPNSNPWDEAFVDPVTVNNSGVASNRSNAWIASAVAHEAGHTFGLAHVLTSPDPEVMSYDAANTRFIDKTFNTTNLNWDPEAGQAVPTDSIQPIWSHWDWAWHGPFIHTEDIVTQNSFTYLETVLGPRSVGSDYANVANTNLVDTAAYTDGVVKAISVGQSKTAYVSRTGDYDVFQVSNASWYGQNVQVDVAREGTSTVNPVVFVYNSSGTTRIAFDDNSGPGVESRTSFYLSPFSTFKIVVGASNGQSTGQYRLTLTGALSVISPIVRTTSYTLTTTSLSSSSSGSRLNPAVQDVERSVPNKDATTNTDRGRLRGRKAVPMVVARDAVFLSMTETHDEWSSARGHKAKVSVDQLFAEFDKLDEKDELFV